MRRHYTLIGDDETHQSLHLLNVHTAMFDTNQPYFVLLARCKYLPPFFLALLQILINVQHRDVQVKVM